MNFPPFDLERLLTTVFEPDGGERVAVMIDLEDPTLVKDLRFLKEEGCEVQKMGYKHVFEGLKNGVAGKLNFTGPELFAYKVTGGSNLDLPDQAHTPDGRVLSFEKDVYPNYDLFLCVSDYSATAPLTASAKKHGFRGATMHGMNQIILDSGLAVDYNLVSEQSERLRQGMTKAEAVEIDFTVAEKSYSLRLELGAQEAQKSHGICRGKDPDIANLPAGEVYFVPTGGKGHFPFRLEDGSIAALKVEGGRVVDAEFLSGEKSAVEAFRDKVKSDPATGWLGELGFGTMDYPISGQDIQDEKKFGTFHIATGRNDHLGGDITTDKFEEKHNASHDDILFSPQKTPEIHVPQVRMYRDGQTHILFQNYEATDFLKSLAYGQPV